MEKNYDDTFLARWIAGELTPEELIEFQKSPEYSEYEKINEGANRFEAPSYDRQQALENLRQQTTRKTSSKTRRLFPAWGYVAAASVLLLLGYFFVFPQQTTISTAVGEHKVVVLPDGSEVALNTTSEVQFNKKHWDKERSLKLHGEAQFTVNQGSEFTVTTSQGTVLVLGTQFMVNAQNDYFDVQCYEGKVQVNLPSSEFTLVRGQSIRVQNGEVFSYQNSNSQAPWLNDESRFQNTPILEVIRTLEHQFDLKITGKEKLTNQNFTGGFSHNNLQTAVKTVFDAMEIKYTFEEINQVSIQK
ncbi:MAG: FecR domain-containing protein [Bacteroidota bacterium]